VKTTRIDLKPKSAEEKNFFNTIQLWIPKTKQSDSGESYVGKREQRLHLLQYSNIKINPACPIPSSS